jgi:hypothetical protein
LESNPQLTFLDLKENFLDPESLQHLFDALGKNMAPEELDLGCTDISDDSLVVLACRSRNMNIHQLGLLRNPCTLVQVVQQGNHIRHVALD